MSAPSSDPAPGSVSVSSSAFVDSDCFPPNPDTEFVEYTFHVYHPPITEEVAKQCQALKEAIMKEKVYEENKDAAEEFMTQQNLYR